MTVLTEGGRFAHIERLREIFGLESVVSDDTVRWFFTDG